MPPLRTIWVISYQLKLEAVPHVQKEIKETDSEKEKKRIQDLFKTHYLITESEYEMQQKLRALDNTRVYNYTFSEVTVKAYALPIEIQ